MIMPDRLINAWNLLQTMRKRKQYQNVQILLANMQVLIMMSHDSLNTRSLWTTYHEIGVHVPINNLYVAVNVLRNLWITCATKLINFDYSSGAKCFTQWWRSFGINVFVYFNCHFMKDHSTGLKKSYDCRKFYCKSFVSRSSLPFHEVGPPTDNTANRTQPSSSRTSSLGRAGLKRRSFHHQHIANIYNRRQQCHSNYIIILINKFWTSA